MLTKQLILLAFLQAVSSIDVGSKYCEDLTGHRNCRLLPSLGECGPVIHGPRIVGGHNAFLGQYPWVAFMNGCGGSIINSRYVLSAAHCCVNEKGRQTVKSVRLGEYDLRTSPDCSNKGSCAPRPQDIRVDRIVVHEEYRRFINDICLIRLKKPIIFHEHVKPICLTFAEAFRNLSSRNISLNIAGWGISKQHKQGRVDIPSILQTATVPVVSRSACQYMYGYAMDNEKICAGAVDGVDSCMGDSGGPLMGEFTVDGPVTKYFLIGVVSYGPRQCGTRRPGVYVKVPSYTEWILENLKP